MMMAITKLNLFNSLLLLMCLCCWSCSTSVQAIKITNQNNTITFNNTVFVTNFNNFKTNLDKAQEYLITIYKGAYGGIGALWFYYAYWLVLSAFYYTFAVTYLNSKDDAKAEFTKNHPGVDNKYDRRAFGGVGPIDATNIFNSLKKFHEKAGGPEMEPCRNRGLCEVRSRLAQTPIYRWIPSFIRRILRLEISSRESGSSCAQLYPDCNWFSLFLKFVQ